MFNTKWHGRAEWATLVAVIFTAGYVAQARAEEPDGEKIKVAVAASADAQVKDVQRAIDAVVQKVQLNQGDDGAVQVQIRLVGQDLKDVDVDDQPAAKVIQRLVTIAEDKTTEGKDSDENEIELSVSANPPSHFLGIQISQVDPILREHLKLDESQGILVIAVVDESPAGKAGVKEHDILLTANGQPLDQLGDLIEVIRQSDGKEISLELIRAGEKMSTTVKPEKRPEHYGTDPAGEVQGFDPDGMKDLRVWVEKLKKNKDLPAGVVPPDVLRLRTLGPGFIFGGRPVDLSKMPGNLSINISKKDDEPAKIKIQQDDKTWEFTSDDTQAIKQLPEKIRKFVEQMLGERTAYTLEADKLRIDIPENLKHVQIPQLHLDALKLSREKASELSEDLMERIEEMEKKIEQLHEDIRQLHGDDEEEEK